MSQIERERVVVNLGCGTPEASVLPPYFDGWKHLRVDIDEGAEPDILADLTDLSPIPDHHADAVWASHCVEHLYEHEVAIALSEFYRIVRPDGFVCIIVPDLQSVAAYVAADRLHETIYQSPAGPVTAHDILFGFGTAIAAGQTFMAHRCGFTPGMFEQQFRRLPFAETLLHRRTEALELVALARVRPVSGDEERHALLAQLGL